MKPRLAIALLALISLSASCRTDVAETKIPPPKLVRVGSYSLSLQDYGAAQKGVFLLGLFDHTRFKKVPITNVLAAIGSDGQVLFQRSFEHRYRPMLTGNFKKLGSNLYGYFLGFIGQFNGPASFHFLDQGFQDVYPRPVPDTDPDLDPHDMTVSPAGNYFFLFHRSHLREASVESEIQEWDPSGKVLFSWHANQFLKPRVGDEGSIDIFHVNSIDASRTGSLLISLNGTSEVARVAYPSGKVAWRVSQLGWTFPNDRLGGFRRQHSVTQLAGERILMFDNGDGTDHRASRAVEYALDPIGKTATLIWEYRAREGNPYREDGGSVQRLSNGNTLIGWGQPREGTSSAGQNLPLFSEVDSGGRLVREMTSRGPIVSYRVSFEEQP